MLTNVKMGKGHIHTKKNSSGKRVPGHHFTAGIAGVFASGLETIGKGLETVGGFMENLEENMPNTMGLLTIFDPIALAEKIMETQVPHKPDNSA